MSVYTKLNDARERFHALKLEKTGHNKFAGYNYFELGDFLIPALRVFKEVGLCAIVSFEKDMATMRIIDVSDHDGFSIVITSPMGSAALKGCHEVQNIGAVETYQRRYLWVAALEIVEHDALDATTGKGTKDASLKHSPLDGAGDSLTDDKRAELDEVALYMIESHQLGKDLDAVRVYYALTDNDEKTYVWRQLAAESKLRALVKANSPHKETA
jgi:hypothetical protein